MCCCLDDAMSESHPNPSGEGANEFLTDVPYSFESVNQSTAGCLYRDSTEFPSEISPEFSSVFQEGSAFFQNSVTELTEESLRNPFNGPAQETMRISCTWFTAWSSLRTAVGNNLEHFAIRTPAHERRTNRFYQCFHQLEEHTRAMQPAIDLLNLNAHKYDFDNVPANGFRSLLSVTDACMCRLVQKSRDIERQREDFLFRKNFHLRSLEEYTKILGALRKMLDYASHMMQLGDNTGSLFPKEGSKLIEEWFKEVETMNQEVFYGRSLGFQYASSVHRMLQTVVLAMAVCADTYRSWEKWKPGSAKLATTIPNMFTTTRFVMRPELRAKQIVHTTRNCDINFCKQFWGLLEASYLQSGFNWILPSVAVNEVIELPPEMIEVTGIAGKNIFVKPPSYSKPIFTRFISDVESSNGEGQSRTLSSSLIFHCHGGGFIAQSSKAHESYLLKWAKDLKLPIFSIDYALAPEEPYPKGLDEVVYAYAWALKNCERLGWTGEKVCFVGDSAGGNLVVAAALKIFCKGLPSPTGILAAYGAFLVQYTPSPSRLLCLMDPLLPMGILTRCLAAYAGIREPSCVGQVQGANDKVLHENLEEESANGAGGDVTAGQLKRGLSTDQQAPGNLRNSSSSVGDLHRKNGFRPQTSTPSTSERDFCMNGDAMDGSPLTPGTPSTPPEPQVGSRWFGRTVSGFFKNLQAKPVQIGDAISSIEDPQQPYTPEDKRRMRGSDKVEPLPRYNFASVSVEDPFLSPLLAEDHILIGLPPVHLVACHLDPLLDDSISFARRLRQLNKPVGLDVMNHLPHGFLNFSLLSAEAADATALCARRIQEILGIETPQPDQ